MDALRILAGLIIFYVIGIIILGIEENNSRSKIEPTFTLFNDCKYHKPSRSSGYWICEGRQFYNCRVIVSNGLEHYLCGGE